MKMRKGEVREFFAPQDEVLGAERRRWLAERPELGLVETPAGKPLVDAAWSLAQDFGHAVPPTGGPCDLAALGRQWEPDLLFVDFETKSFAAACVCLPSSWDPRRRVGRGLTEVHGVVPRLQEQIGAQIDRFLERLEPGKGFRRENWSLTLGGELNFHPALGRKRLAEDTPIEDVFLRVEQQLFTGLPGGVLMGLRIKNCPLLDLAADPEVWEMATEKIATMPDDVAEYKSLRSIRDPLAGAMQKMAGS